MNQVLLLSKNLFTDHHLEKKLQKLNYEVFLSTSLLEQIQYSSTIPYVLNYFQFVLVSKTINNDELRELTMRLKKHPITFLREVEVEPSKKIQEYFDKLEIHGHLQETYCLEEIREQMKKAQENKIEKLGSIEPSNIIESIEKNSLSGLILSKTEIKLLKLLVEADGKLVRREEICQSLWTSGFTKSNKSQLSYLISKIKKKFTEAGLSEEIIITVWGRGYKIDPASFDGQQFLWDQMKISKGVRL